MRAYFFAGAAIVATVASSAESSALKDLMVKVIEPSSNAVFYVSREAPTTDAQWQALQAQTLKLKDAASLLIEPARAKDKGQWVQDAKLLVEVSNAAVAAAKTKNQAALEELNDSLYTACATCHEHYLPKR
jgi:hypothetical protein